MKAQELGSEYSSPRDLVVVDPAPEMQELAQRIGWVHLRQRLGIEADHATQVFGRGRTFFHIENWHSMHGLMRATLWSLGLYGQGRRNARNIQVRHNEVLLERLPPVLDGFTLLQITDLHLDMDPAYPDALNERLQGLHYDLCVLTGDYRARTYGDYEPALAALAQVRPQIHGPVYAVLGNHDTIRMVPGMERLGIQLLLNEAEIIRCGRSTLHLAGIDDAHYYQLENFEKAAGAIPHGAVAILLSHSPEPYRRAAHAGFDLMLSGHTHGGQICLPGRFPLMTNAACPRRFCRGAWRYHRMQGYTSAGSGASVVNVRYNCPPEIVLHHLRRAQ